jgi:hypothetical protein
MSEVKINSIDENYKDLQALIECLNIDMDKFQKKNVKAAGQRARNNLLNTKKLCDILRKQIITEIKEIPVKHRITDDEGSDTKEEAEETPEAPNESQQPEPEPEPEPEPVKPKTKRTRKANKKKLTREDIKDD